MNKQQYYNNKILYALQKIDYARTKLKGGSMVKPLSKVYQVLITYNGKVGLQQIINLTKMSKEEVYLALKELKGMGVLHWQGKRLSKKKQVDLKHDKEGLIRYLKDLEKKTGAKFEGSLKLPSDEEFEKMFPSDQEVDDTVAYAIESTKKESKQSEWIDVPYKDGIVLKVRKDKLKQLL